MCVWGGGVGGNLGTKLGAEVPQSEAVLPSSSHPGPTPRPPSKGRREVAEGGSDSTRRGRRRLTPPASLAPPRISSLPSLPLPVSRPLLSAEAGPRQDSEGACRASPAGPARAGWAEGAAPQQAREYLPALRPPFSRAPLCGRRSCVFRLLGNGGAAPARAPPAPSRPAHGAWPSRASPAQAAFPAPLGGASWRVRARLEPIQLAAF